MAPDLEPAITLPWLIRLRWLFAVGQFVVLPLARSAFGLHLTWWLFAVVLAISAASNVALTRLASGSRWSPSRLMGWVLIFDTALLTIQLGALGGAANPFTVFYLVYITLSAVVLSARWTTAIAACAIAGFALLFVVPTKTHLHHTGPALFNPHLQGMWAALVLAAAATAYFIRRITRAIAFQRDQIATLRETAAQNARLASLATLAAGAAHELNSPLSTIAVAAHEASLAVRGETSVASDLALILAEVDRCQTILHRLAARATGAERVESLSPQDLVERVAVQLGDSLSGRLDLRLTGNPIALVHPSEPLVQSIAALVKNGLDASSPTERVTLAIAYGAAGVSMTIEDKGSGIADEVLAKVGEPFFSTKQPGQGMGLGVFLARVFVESRGGTLSIESIAGIGTRASVRLPLAEAAT